jgi:hypothetical protein
MANRRLGEVSSAGRDGQACEAPRSKVSSWFSLTALIPAHGRCAVALRAVLVHANRAVMSRCVMHYSVAD